MSVNLRYIAILNIRSFDDRLISLTSKYKPINLFQNVVLTKKCGRL